MTLEDIVSTIKGIAADNFSNYSCIFESWEDAGTALDRASLPAIVVVLPVAGSFTIRNGRIYDTTNIAVAFVDKVRRTANGDDNHAVTQSQKNNAAQFLGYLNSSGVTERLDLVTYSLIYERKSSIITGIYMDIQLTTSQGACL